LQVAINIGRHCLHTFQQNLIFKLGLPFNQLHSNERRDIRIHFDKVVKTYKQFGAHDLQRLLDFYDATRDVPFVEHLCRSYGQTFELQPIGVC
jgi:hypothetical protein